MSKKTISYLYNKKIVLHLARSIKPVIFQLDFDKFTAAEFSVSQIKDDDKRHALLLQCDDKDEQVVGVFPNEKAARAELANILSAVKATLAYQKTVMAPPQAKGKGGTIATLLIIAALALSIYVFWPSIQSILGAEPHSANTQITAPVVSDIPPGIPTDADAFLNQQGDRN